VLRAPLAVLLLLALPATAAPPVVYSDAGPFAGKLFFDPILQYDVAYSEPGSTDCSHPPETCIVEGPGQAANWVRVEIAGKGSVHFYLDDRDTKLQIASGTCKSTGVSQECIYRLAKTTSSSHFFLQVTNTTGEAGSAISLYLESGYETCFAQRCYLL